MALHSENFEDREDLARFLDKFKEPDFLSEEELAAQTNLPAKEPLQKDSSFEKLERKIQELEGRFEASAEQNERILQELSETRQSVERQQSKDEFIAHLSETIANLKASVEKLSRAQQEQSFAFRDDQVQRGFDTFPQAPARSNRAPYDASYYQEERRRQEQEEKERIISSLHYKASQLKAVNSALDREIKKVQQEKMEALKKSAEQAKEILSLRDQLTQAEERFKSFDFEGRIISVRQEYEQRVNSLETQLKEISDTCMKQVEEIETLRAENIKLQQVAVEKEQVLMLLEEKERELQSLKEQMATVKEQSRKQSQQQQKLFAEQIRSLEAKRGELAAQFAAAQNDLQSVRSEKEVLEKNFRELVQKINNNDAVLEQLKQKIDVLTQQNEELIHHNEQLLQDNEQLAQDNEQLSQDNEHLVQDNAHLSQHNNQLAARNTQLEQDNHILADANHTLADEKQRLEAQQAQQPRQTPPPPILRQVTKTPTAPLLPKKSPVIHLDDKLTEKVVAEHISSQPVSAEDLAALEKVVAVPVKGKKKQAPKEEDLPEIKTAEPIPQPEVSLDRDDFLEKTDSFLGRIKWSIFREDR